MPELAEFVIYVVNQWFVGSFSNWQIFKTPPGFANTNNPLESFNKIIKAVFTHFVDHRLFHFIMIILEHMLPYYCSIEKKFSLYRVPHKTTVQKARNLVVEKFTMIEEGVCKYVGTVHVHTINFFLRSCSCRWFLAFGVCGHLVAACDIFDQTLEGYTKTKSFVYRPRRGRKKRDVTISAAACSLIPIINIPASAPVIESRRQDLYQVNQVLPLPAFNLDYVPAPEPVSEAASEERNKV